MTKSDPHDQEPPYTYECVDCGERIEAETLPGACEECGGDLRNISTPQER